MNAIYKVIWNDAIRQYQVVNELCRSCRKACSVKAVHTESASGSHSVVSSLKRGALIAGTTLAMLTAWVGAAQANPVNISGSFTWNIGTNLITGADDPVFDLSNTPVEDLPGEDEVFRVYIGENTTLIGFSENIQNQDESSTAGLIYVPDGYFQQWNPSSLVFNINGQDTNELTEGTTLADFTYALKGNWDFSEDEDGRLMVGLSRQLRTIALKSQIGVGQHISASEQESADLSASITGSGNISFGFTAQNEGQEGWLILNDFEDAQSANDYTGSTWVGYNDQGQASDSVHLIFGKDKAFGNTNLLNVHENSEVRFGGMEGDQAYTQTVGGLSGAGTLALGSAAQLTLAQSVQQGIIDNESDKIAIQNDITGTGATGSTSGAVFNIELSGEVGGYEVVFADQDVDGEDFTGLITLKNGAVTAYRDDRSDSVGDYAFEKVNQILTGSTLQLKDNAWLKIDETGSVNNLIVSNGVGGLEYSGLANVGDDEYALKVTGDLTLDGDATVYIEDLDFDLMKGEAQDRNLLAADDGFRTHLIDVESTSITNGHSFTLDERNQRENQVSNITQGEGENKETVAKGTWELEDTLRDNGDGTFDLAYTLTKVEVLDGKTLQLTGEADATEVQNFIAQITDADGTGNVEFSAGEGASGSGTVIEVGYQSGEGEDAVYNDYTGTTTVTEGTTVVLIRDSGFGDTSELLAQGDVTLSDGIKQTIHGINSNGSGTITLNGNSELTLDADSAQTINNVVAGTGDFIVDLGSSGNNLIFKNDQQGNRFTGDLTLSNGRFSLGEGQNADIAANAGIVLNSGAAFDLGTGSQTIKELTVNESARLESSALVIGSQTPAHTVDGNIQLNADTTLTLTGISVEEDLSLVDYDGASHAQQFISGTAVVGSGTIELAGSGNFDLENLKLDYTQEGEVVAETVWKVGNQLTPSGNGLDVGVELTEIKLIGNTIISGTGTDNELSALISDSASGGAHSLQFSTAEENGSATFIVNYEGGNTYTGATTVDSDVSVVLAVNSGFGTTSLLTVADSGSVTLQSGVSQTVKGLSGSGTIALNEGATFTLSQTGNAEVGNLLSGVGTFQVDLGGVGYELSFTNSGASGFAGTVELSNGFLSLDSENVTQSVMDGASLVLGSGGMLSVAGTSSYQAKIGSLVMNAGSQLSFGTIDFGAAKDTPQLNVSGALTISGSGTLTVGEILLDGTMDILTANTVGLKQLLVEASGGISGYENLSLPELTDKSEIANTVGGETVAYGVWSKEGNGFTVEDNSKLYAALKLTEIQLAADDGTGLILDLTDQNASLDAKLTNYGDIAGDLTLSGPGNITITNAANDFTGGLYVESGAKVTLGATGVLGSSGTHASLLEISGNGSQVNFNGTTQYLSALNTSVADALTGSGSLTLDGSVLTSGIQGANSSLTADVSLKNGHTLVLNDVFGIGSAGTVHIEGTTDKLVLEGASGGFGKVVSGNGTVELTSGSAVNIPAENGPDNSHFSGTWVIGGDEAGNSATLSVSRENGSFFNSALGSDATVELGENGKLRIEGNGSGYGTISLSQTFAGSGVIEVVNTSSHTSPFSFEFSTTWDPDAFDGTLSLSSNQLSMDVGGNANTGGSNNAHNLANADLILSNGAIINVNGDVKTFDRVSSSDNGTFKLSGLGFSSPDAVIVGISKLTVGSIDLADGQKLTLQVNDLSENADLLGSVRQSSLISGGINPFQTLIATEDGIELNGGTFDEHFVFSGVDDSKSYTQDISDGNNTVASGYYKIKLALGNNGNDLGIQYTLDRIDILDTQTLTLSETGFLDAQITSSGNGNLTIASTGDISLTNGENTYTGNTTIDADGRLVATQGALGQTDELFVSGTYVNSGANTVNRLDVGSSGQLELDADLTLSHSGDASSVIAGSLTGSGDINVSQGELSITENTGSSGYSGAVSLGTVGGEDGTLVLNGAYGLDNGSIVFNTAASEVKINDEENVLFTNEMSGTGVINVTLAGNDFAFGSEQTNLSGGSSLILNQARFDLTASAENDNDEVAEKLYITLNNGSTLANDGLADKTILGLTLNGGTVDFGALESGAGQISLSGGKLVIAKDTTNTIAMDSQGLTSESGDRTLTDSGAELLAGGLFDLTLFEQVGSIDADRDTADDSGNQKIESGLQTSGFSGSTENLFQDADGDGARDDYVATMTRDDGAFYYNDAKDSVFLQYTFKEIKLLWENANQGLTIDGTGDENAQLSARVTGKGNLRLGGTILISGASSVNDYTGRTYILDDAEITVGQDSGFGVTKELNIAKSGKATIADGISQTVGSLTDSGSLVLGSGAQFTVDNGLYKDDRLEAIAIKNTIAGNEGAQFTIDADGASVSFTKSNKLTGTTFELQNAQFAIDNTDSFNYDTAASSKDFVLGVGTTVTMTADDTAYSFNELSFSSGGLSVNGVTLTPSDSAAATNAVIKTGVLDVTNGGTLSVAAEIDDSFDLLANDSDEYASTVIKYGSLKGDSGSLTDTPTLAESAIQNDDDQIVAYIGWDGDVIWTPEEGGSSGYVGMEYHVDEVRLYDDAEGSQGLVLTAQDGNTDDWSALTATVVDYSQTKAGTITFAGTNAITIGDETHQEANTYTGRTNVVSGASVTFAKDAAFGQTRYLAIDENSTVHLNGHEQTVGELDIASGSAIEGEGTLTLGSSVYANNTSTVFGTSSNLTGTVALTNGHVLTMDAAEGLGTSGTFSLAADTEVLVQNDINTSDAHGTFGKSMSGEGSVVFESSTYIDITGNNAAFTGDWMLKSGSTAFVSGTETLTADELLGSGGKVTLDGANDVLQVSQSSGNVELDNVFAGAGRLEVLGTGEDTDQSFSFSSTWENPADFTGTLSLKNGIDMTVGGVVGANNAANLTNADLELDNSVTLTVAQQATVVNTFDELLVNGGTISFAGEFGLGVSPSALAQLQVGSLSGSGNIALAIPSGNGETVDQTIEQNELLTVDKAGAGLFQALITVDSGSVSADGWTLNGSDETSGEGLRQAVTAGIDPVAHAIYDYRLTTGDIDQGTDNALGVGYDLTAVDILDGKTLTLSDSGALGATIENSSGAGNLTITGQIELTGQNTYSGATLVSGSNAELTVSASGLGSTSSLTLETGVAFFNAGTNAVGYLDAVGAGITLNNVFTVKGTSDSRIEGGTVNGNGAFNLDASTLEVIGTVNGDYSGLITLGSGSSAAHLQFTNADGLGSGTVAFANDESTVIVSGSASTTLTNTYSGNGQIDVDLGGSGHLFAFSQGQTSGAFTGMLSLTEAGYNLYEDNGVLTKATLETGVDSLITVNSDANIGDRQVGSLSLNGGRIDFGELSFGSESGQIVVSKDGQFGIRTDGSNNNTTINVSLADSTDAAASTIFDANNHQSILLIEDFDATDQSLEGLILGDSEGLTQNVIQSGRGAEDDLTALLTYASGALTGTTSGIEAGWTLTQIELKDASGEGLLVDASGETGESGTISALISGNGNLEIGGGTVSLNQANTYVGTTTVSGEARLVLENASALGNSGNALIVKDLAYADFGNQSVSIGSIQVGENAQFNVRDSNTLTLTSGNSLIESANTHIVSGSIAVENNASLKLRNENALGALRVTVAEGAEVLFSQMGEADRYARIQNSLSGSGTYVIGDGENEAYVQLLQGQTIAGTIRVEDDGHLRVNTQSDSKPAIGSAALSILKGGYAELNGAGGWTLDNALTVAEGAELAVSAGGIENTFAFGNAGQSVSGTVSFADLRYELSGGSMSVLSNAAVRAGDQTHVIVATGNAPQQVKDFTLGSGAQITFAGTLGVDNVDTTVLGQMQVTGSLTLESGSTVHVNLDENASASSSISQLALVSTALSGTFQNLISANTVEGSAVGTDGEITGIALTDTDGDPFGQVTGAIYDADNTKVATGYFGANLLVKDQDSGQSFGVQYGLQSIDIEGALEISESGTFAVDITSNAGTGSLTVSAGGEGLTLSGDNSYTVATYVSGTLTAEAGALGQTQLLDISDGAIFTNAGANTVGRLDSQGTLVLNDALTVTNATPGGSQIDGTVSGSEALTIESGSLVSSATNTNSYTGDVTLGTTQNAASMTLEASAGAHFGSRTIRFANEDSALALNTSGASVLGNLLSGTGQVSVSGTSGESFAFRDDQTAGDWKGKLTLTNVAYDFTNNANDILSNVSLTVNGTTFVVNDAEETATRKVNGMSLEGGTIQFGTIGNGDGYIDLQGQTLSTSADSQTRLDAATTFAVRDDASGSAAFEGVADETLLLIGNAATGTTEDVLDGLTFGETDRDFTRDLRQDGTVTARIHGTIDGLELTTNEDGTKNIDAGLTNSVLELVADQTYGVYAQGEIALQVSGAGNLGAYNDLTLSNNANNYTGNTTVSGDGVTLTLANDGALGQSDSHTDKLTINSGAAVDFGVTSQVIGSIDATGDGALVSAKNTAGKLTIANGGTIDGVNADFGTDIELAVGSAHLTLKNAQALGSASVNLLGDGTDVVLSGVSGQFVNDISGSGGLTVADESSVALAGANGFTGDLTVETESTVTASGDVFSHIGTGDIVLGGQADFTQTDFSSSDVWKWNRTVSGYGVLNLSTDGAHELVLESGFANFAGTLSLGDLSLSLSSGGRALQSLETFSGSAIKHMVLESGADLHLDGETKLTSQADAFDVTMKSGGSFVFEGIAVPGAEDAATNTTHLTVGGTLKLEKGFELSLSTQEGAKVDPTNGKSLLEQDDDGMTIDVIAANDIQGDVSQGKVTLDGGGDTTFEIVNAEGTTVADGYYGFDIVSGSSGGLDTISLEYKLDRVEIRGGETLELKGEGDASLDSNTLKAEVTGSGDLSIAGNVTLDAANSYTGETIVTAGSKLYANENALGTVDGTLSAVTSNLRVEEGGEALINGFNTVEGLEIKKGGTLTIGSSSGAVPENPVMLTLKSDESAGSRLDGTLNGTGTIKVVGSGDVDDDDNPADLTIVGSQGDFLGDLVLDSGAWIDLAANSLNIFGSSSSDASNRILVSEDSLLTIHSNNNHDASFGGVFEDGLGGKGGRIEVTLASADNDFTFSDRQAEVVFTGTFALEQGTIDLGNLYSTTVTDASHNALDDATLELGANGKAILRASTSQTSEDTLLGGLTMRGGTIEFGSINYEAGDDSSVSGAHASHIDLGGDGILDLYAPVTGDDGGVSQSTITIAQNETNRISDAGSELLAADDGTRIVLIHGIGSLYADGTDVTDRADEYGAILNDYLHLENDAAETQLLEQAIESGESTAYAQVAEVVRTFADELTFGKSNLEGEEDNYAVSLGYSVDRVGLLHQTADATADNFEDKTLWQGLTITTSENADRNTFEALITDASDGLAGNLVLKGNTQAAENVLTISGETNTYTGKTWVTEGANIAFGVDNAFGKTEALRIESGSSVDLNGHSQTVGMLFALGDDALKGASGSLTVSGEALILGANQNYAGDIALNGHTSIKNAASLGTGTTSLGSNVTLEISGASGSMTNVFKGDVSTAINVQDDSAIVLNKDAIAAYEGTFGVADNSTLDFTIAGGDAESDAALGNLVTVAEDAQLTIRTDNGGGFYFGNLNSSIEGELVIENAKFAVPKPSEQGQSVLKGAELTVGNKGDLVVSYAVGTDQVTDLTLGNGSSITFEGGATPGSAGADSDNGHVDLGTGKLTMGGDITVKVDVGGYVNADMVKDSQEAVTNLPLTATDLVAGTTDSVLANLISGDYVADGEVRLELEAIGGNYDVENDRLEVGIFNDAANPDRVATGTYDYKVSIDEEGENEGLNLSYGLVGVNISGGKTLELRGYEGEDFDNELAVAIEGDGSLMITSGTVSITGANTYKGETTVAAGAELMTSSNGSSLGSTSMLRVSSTGEGDNITGSTANIRGTETVGGLLVNAGSTLKLGHEAGGTSSEQTVFTIDSTVTDSHSVIAGTLEGGDDTKLVVKGNGDNTNADLTVQTANKGFLGNIELNRAHVKLESLYSLGVDGSVVFDKDSTLEISSSSADATTNDNHYGDGQTHNVHIFQNTLVGEGTLRVSLDNADDYFDFDESQYHYPSGEEQKFTGTLELESGIFKFTEDNADVLQSVHVVLNESGTLDISANATNTVDRTMRGLTLEGGTLEFGSLSIDRVNSESMSAHIDLMGNNLTLVDSEHKASISFDQNAANNLSSSGSEVVNASDSDGSKIVLIHDIGDLKIRDASGAEHNIGSADNLNDYFELDLADTSTAQTLKQALTTAGPDGELTDVAVVHRNFGAFGYENLADVNLGNAVYVGYKIDSIELIHSAPTTATGDTLWEGLTVSTSEASHELRAQITGHGNLVIANGTGGTLVMGVDDDNSANDNSYTGRTWVQAGASVAFAADNAFGSTSALRIDAGANVDLGAFEQTVGNLYANSDNALSGGDDSLLVVTGNAEISGTNENFTGTLVFNSNDATTGFVDEVEGLGKTVVLGGKYMLEVTDQDQAGTGPIELASDITDYIAGEGGVLSIGSIDAGSTGSRPIALTGDNSGFSGTIRVHDGWSLSAAVDKDISDRLGTGSLDLIQNGSAVIDFVGQNVSWNHVVTGDGRLTVSADKDSSVSIEGGLENFSGTLAIGGGAFNLAGNKENLGNASGIAAEGEDTKFHVSSDGSLEFGKNVVVSDGASLVFDDAINFSEQADPELEIDGTLSLNDATVKVTMEGDVEIGDQPDGSLDMGAITLADEGEIEYVIAEADRIERGNYKLEIAGPSGALTTDVAITDNGRTVATGTYDFGLSVARGEEKDSLGLSYQLTAVDIRGGETLRLAGADDNTALADRDNASVFSADIKGAGNLSLVTGELTLTGDNTYSGETTIGADGAQAVLTVGEGSSLGTTSAVTVNASSALVNESTKTTVSRITVAEGGALNLDAWREQSGLRKVSRLELTNGASVINGTFFGEGELVLSNDASVDINNMADYEYTGRVTVGEDARYALHAEEGTTFEVRNDFSAKHDNNGNQIENAGTVAFDGNGATFNLQGSASGFTNGTFSLGDDVTLTASNIDAIGGEGSTMLITTADENDSAVFRFAYDEVETDLYLALTQTMTKGITFEKTGDGVVELSDNAMGAGEVDVKAGGILFGTAKTTDAYNTALTVESGGWAAGFGGVSGLTVQREGSFYVGGRSGYNSILNGVSTLAEGDEESGTNTVKFTVKGGVSNSGVIYVGNKTTEGAAPADEGAIGNELVIEGDYNVTASDNGGILDMNAVIAGNDDSKADHVTITGKINGNGYVDVNYDSTVSTGGTLEYLGLVKVEGGDDGDSLRLKDTIKIGDLWYRLMWSSDQNEYYLQSSVTDPGDKPWDTEDVENVNAGTRSALAFMQAQAFDLSLRGHLGETLYVDPVTGEQRKSSFWMVQRGDWTKFSNASGQMDADGNLYTTHLGTDLFKRETDGATFRWGVLAGFADGDFDVSSNVDGKSSKGSFRGYSAGLYMTAESKAESGPFLGLQLRWNRFDSEVGQDDYDVNGLSITAEASWDQLLSKGITDGGRNYEWRLEPHVRAYWTNFGDPDDWTSSLGETYSSDFDNGLLVRVGARTKIQTTLGTGPAWQAYAEANWVYNNGDYSTTMSTKYGDVTSTQNGAEFAEFRLGLEAQFTTNVNVWLEGHHQTGSDDYESTGAMFGFKYMW